MDENYNTMVYGDQKFKSFAEIFNYGLSLCKWWKKKKAHDFFTAYIYYLYNVNTREDVPTIEYAEQCVKKNFGYFAGYYGDDVRKKVYDYFEAAHPVFDNRYNVTNKEAFYTGMQIAMKYIIRILRVLFLVLVIPIIFATFCVGIAMMPLTYGAISAYFYVKDGDNYNSKNSDYYTDVVFHFFMETIWAWPIEEILKVK